MNNDLRAKLIIGAKDSIEMDQKKLDYYNAHGHYTAEDSEMFRRTIERQTQRIKELTNG